MQILFVPIAVPMRRQRLGNLGVAKADALKAWYAADGAIQGVERLLYQYATEFRDNAAWVSGAVKKLRDDFAARFSEVQEYGEWTTRWGKYEEEGKGWETQASNLLAQMNAILLQLPNPPPPPPDKKQPDKTPTTDNAMLWVAGGAALLLVAVALSKRNK